MRLRKRKGILRVLMLLVCMVTATQAEPIDIMRALSAGVKAFQAYTISDSQLQEYVRESVRYMDSQNTVMPASSDYSKRLARLTGGLTKVNGVPLNFKVYRQSEVNAFACADGSVRVYTALMDIMSDNELLGIIGHEVGHVGLQHSKKALKQELLTGALKDALASTGGRAAALTDSMLGDIGASLINSSYSRKQEQEADDYGYDFLKKSGKNPWAMVMAFEKLKSMEGKSNAVSKYVNKMFSSHPDTDARIKRMTARCNKDGIARPK